MKRRINRFFINFLAAYVLLILVPLVSGMLINRAIVKEYEGHVRQAQSTYLKNAREVLEAFIEDIKWSTYQLAGNTKLLRLISDRDRRLSSQERAALIRETMLDLNNSLLYNTSFNSIFYVYLKHQDIIITPYSIYTHRDFNNSVNFFKMENVDSAAWHDAISSRYYQGKIMPVRTMIIEDFKNKRMIPYVQTIPIVENADPERIDGAIVYLIGETDFIRFLNYDGLPPGGASYIADQDQNLICLVSRAQGPLVPLNLEGEEGMVEKTINGNQMFVIYTTSRKNNWKYVSLLPEEWVMKSVTFYQVISFAVMFLSLLFCLVVAYSLSQHWSHPLAHTFNSLSGYLNHKDRISFSTLSSSVDELIHQSENMRIFVHNSFVNRLINGLFRKEGNLEAYLNHLGLQITENCFSIALLTPENLIDSETAESFDESLRFEKILKNRLQSDFSVRFILSEQNSGDFILILMTRSESCREHDAKVENAFEKFLETMPDPYTDRVQIALGEAVPALIKVHRSYLQAQEVLSMEIENKGERIRHVRNLDKKPGEFYYPLELESRLINTVKAGRIKSLETLLKELKKENYDKKILDDRQRELLHESLYHTCLRILRQLPEKTIEKLNRELPSGGGDFDSFQSFLMDLCFIQGENKKSHNQVLVENIETYLRQKYGDRNLSLQSVADTFSITESYLSSFFKEQTGINFSTFLENIRMDVAREQLLSSNESIHTIAAMVGYNSDKSFRRVFQKHYNTSPGQFRETGKRW